MQPISPRLHGVLDYLVGALIVSTPWLFGFAWGGVETWVLVVAGAATIAYSALTDYDLGLAHRIPLPIHLALDFMIGAVVAFSPWLFGFADLVRAPHVLLGAFGVAIALLTSSRPAAAEAAGD